MNLYNLFLQHPIITTDSRDCPAGSLFFALKGESFDGNRFAQMALDKGCAYAIVDEKEYIKDDDERFVLVDDALTALQELANYHRRQFRGPVIQITGTNGKTTTKELVSAVLAQKFRVLFTQGNFNNHIGVPKTLLSLNKDHEIAVIETGANHPGEIAMLSKIVEPDCGLITNVGVAHIEGFGTFEGVVKTKGELYDYLRQNPEGFIFLHADNEHLLKISSGLKAITYGRVGEGYFVEGEVVECAPFLKLRWRPGNRVGQQEWHEVQTQLIGSYNLANALAAVSVGLHFGLQAQEIDKALSAYEPKNNRSQMLETERNSLIVDAYNANPSSMKAALDNFSLISPREGQQKMLILGDMKELGVISEQEHRAVVERIRTLGFKEVWLVGENFKSLNSEFPTFADVEEVKTQLNNEPVANRLVLIKGSNSTRLFQLPEYL